MKKKHLVMLAVATALIATSVVYSGPKRAGPNDIYPTAPGAINTDITQDTISQTLCNASWSTKSIRPPASYTTALKIKQLKDLGATDTNTADYEEDHIISLELGGNPTDPNNLWPELYHASIPHGGAKDKDSVENYLHRALCNGSITLAEAQKKISTDWYAVFLTMQKPSPSTSLGAVDVSPVSNVDEDDQ